MRRESTAPKGFIISLELILIFTILVIGTLVGVIAVRNALFRLAAVKSQYQTIIEDSTVPDPLRLRPVSFDLCEAPQVLCFDPATRLSALVGVRPDRFVSRDQVYFTAPNCAGSAYLAIPGDATLPVGYRNALQGVSYGVGPPSVTSLAGRLFRSDNAAGPMAPTILSRWVSLAPDCAAAATLCDNFGPVVLTLLPAVEVLDATATDNLLAAFTPPFTVLPAPLPTVTFTPPVPENAPLQDETAPGSTTDPGDPLTFTPPGPEGP